MWIPTSEGRNSAVNPDLTFPVTFTGISSVGPEIKCNELLSVFYVIVVYVMILSNVL